MDRLFDTGFVFAEVNSDIVFQTKDKYGNVTPYKVDTTHIGKCIYTKAIGSTNRVDITHTYKHPEGDVEAELRVKPQRSVVEHV